MTITVLFWCNMKYDNIVKGIFLERPNRFIAICDIDGKEETCHVKNTGRCRELLINGVTVFLEKSSNPKRKTQYDLIAVEKNGRLINMDSQVVNKVAFEFLPTLFDDIEFIKPEYKYGKSRIDFYIETKNEKVLVEVKGVTLEEDGVVRFPDAPTERGVKHLKELQKAVVEGYKAYMMFVVQMSHVKYFEPNMKTHLQFASALKEASDNGVNVLAYDCCVTPESIKIRKEVPIKI